MTDFQLECFQEAACRLDYDRETGEFTWLPKPLHERGARQWNGRYSGKIAGSIVASDGYRHFAVIVRGVSRKLLAHRLVWFIETGSLPRGEIDHINRDRTDNRFSNLRDVTASLNQRNRTGNSNNTSGYPGVTWNRQAQRWQAQAKVEGKNHYLGLFINKDAAGAAAREFRAAHGFIENHAAKCMGEAP